MASYTTHDPKRCAHKGCKSSFVPHRWAPETNKGTEWFHQRNGDSWCPSHIPDWVSTWRKRRGSNGNQEAEA